MCCGAVVLDVPTSPAVLDVPWRGGAGCAHVAGGAGCAVARWCPWVAPPCCGAPGWRLRARALTGAAVVVLSGKLRLVVVVLVVMLVTP